MNASLSGLFIVGLIALSYGASQQNALAAIIGVVLMLGAGVGGFIARRKNE